MSDSELAPFGKEQFFEFKSGLNIRGQVSLAQSLNGIAATPCGRGAVNAYVGKKKLYAGKFICP